MDDIDKMTEQMTTLIEESNRLYAMLQECLESREKFRAQAAELLRELTALKGER
jgi:uncharacterized protein YhaN